MSKETSSASRSNLTEELEASPDNLTEPYGGDSIEEQETLPNNLKVLSTEEIEETYKKDYTEELESYPDNLLALPPKDVLGLYRADIIDADTANTYADIIRFRNEGLLSLNRDSVLNLYRRGIINKEAADRYYLAKTSPLLFELQEGSKSVFRGVGRALLEGHVQLNQVFHKYFNPFTSLADRFDVDQRERENVEAAWATIIPEKYWGKTSELWTAELAGGVAQFTVGLASYGKAINVTKVASTLRNSKVLTELAKKSPKLAGWLARVGAEATQGALVDYLAFNPKEGRLAEVLKEHDVLGEAVPEFMLTDLNNPESVERLKGVLEGAFLGTAGAAVASTLLVSLKALKSTLHIRTGGDPIAIKQILKDDFNITTRDVVSGDFSDLDRIGKIQEGVGLSPKLFDQDGAVGYQGGPSRPESTGRQYTKKAEELFFKLDADNIADRQDAFIRQISDTEDAYKLMNGVRSMSDDTIEQYTRGIQPDKTVKKTGIKELHEFTGAQGEKRLTEAVQELFGSTRFLAERVSMVNQIFKAQQQKVLNNIAKVDMTFAEKTNAMADLSELLAMTNEIYGIRAEIGRGLRHSGFKDILDIDVSKMSKELQKTHTADVQAAERAMDNVLGLYRNAKTDRARYYVAKTGTTKANKALRTTLGFTQANLLWRLATHKVNIAGGALAFSNETFKRTVGAAYLAAARKDWRHTLETVAWLHGTGQGIKESFKIPGINKRNFTQPKAWKEGFVRTMDMDSEAGNVWKVLFSGQSQTDSAIHSKFTEGLVEIAPEINKFKEVMGYEGKVSPGFLMSVGDLLHKLPFHGLAATDQLLKNIGTYSEIHGKAWRNAVETTQGNLNKVTEVYQGALKNATREQFYEGLQMGRTVTYTQAAEHPWSILSDKLMATTPFLALRIGAIPFYKIILNIATYSRQNSPLGLASVRNWRKLRAGGIDRAETIAGMLGGTAIMIWAAQKYADGELTGHVPPDMRTTQEAAGVLDYAIKVDEDKWLDYSRFDYISTLVGVGANLHRVMDIFKRDYIDEETAGLVDDRFNKLIGAFGITVSDSIINKTFAEGLMSALEMFTHSEGRDWGKFMARQSSKFVPFATGLSAAQLALVDDFVREKDSIMDEFRSFYYLKGVPIKRHPLYGTPIEMTERIGGFETREESDDIVVRTIMKLGMSISKPSDEFNKTGVNIEFSREQWAKYNDILETLPVKETLTQIIEQEFFQEIQHDEFKIELLRKEISEFRKIARDILVAEDEELFDKYEEELILEEKALRGEIKKPSIRGAIQRVIKE